MTEAIIFMTGLLSGAGLLFAVTTIMESRCKTPPSLVERLLDMVDTISLPPWSSGSPLSWLHSRLRDRLNGCGIYQNDSDEVFIVMLFLIMANVEERERAIK